MKFFAPSHWQPLREYPTRKLAIPNLPLQHAQLPMLQAAAKAIPNVPDGLRTFQHGPEPAGAPVTLENTDPRIPLDLYLLHSGTLLLGGIVHGLGLPAVLAGFWGRPTTEQLSLAIWFDLGNSRLAIFPSLRLVGRELSMQLAHVVWLRQGWMTGHNPAKDEDWADLSTNYQRYFNRAGYAYYEVTEAFRDKKFYWQLYRSPNDALCRILLPFWPSLREPHVHFCDASESENPIFQSESFKSFYHFQVGEPLCPRGSEAGIMLQRVQRFMAEQSQVWRQTYAAAPELLELTDMDEGQNRRIAEQEY